MTLPESLIGKIAYIGVVILLFGALAKTVGLWTPTSFSKVNPNPATHVVQVADAGSMLCSDIVTIQPNDTLEGLAAFCGTTVEALQRLNELCNSTVIYSGTAFRIR